MTALTETLAATRRPRLLVRAARFGMEEYNRSRDLRRIFRGDSLPAPRDALPRLMDLEAAQEAIRQRGDASYSIARHLDILIALMAESRTLCRATSQW